MSALGLRGWERQRGKFEKNSFGGHAAPAGALHRGDGDDDDDDDGDQLLECSTGWCHLIRQLLPLRYVKVSSALKGRTHPLRGYQRMLLYIKCGRFGRRCASCCVSRHRLSIREERFLRFCNMQLAGDTPKKKRNRVDVVMLFCRLQRNNRSSICTNLASPPIFLLASPPIKSGSVFLSMDSVE